MIYSLSRYHFLPSSRVSALYIKCSKSIIIKPFKTNIKDPVKIQALLYRGLQRHFVGYRQSKSLLVWAGGPAVKSMSKL